MRRRWGSSPGFLGNPFGSMPRARDSGDPGATSHIGRPSAAFRLVNSVGIATSRVFGAESSRPASLLCTLRTHWSPGEWQHSLPACLLDSDRRDLHPLDSIKKFHRLISVPPLPSFSQRDNNVGGIRQSACAIEYTNYSEPHCVFGNVLTSIRKNGLHTLGRRLLLVSVYVWPFRPSGLAQMPRARRQLRS